MRLSVFAPAALLCLSPLLGCAGSDPPANDPNQYAANGQYPQQGQPGQYPQQGQPGQYPQQGQPGQYQQPGQAGQYQQPGQYPQQGQPGQYPQPGQPAGQPGAQPGTQPAASTGQATPIPMAAMLTPAIQAMAAAEVPGMQPDGQAFAGQFQEGQTLEQALNIQPGKCYSVIAASAGVQQLDIQIVLSQPPLPPVVLAQSNSTGGNATLGGKSAGCWKNPTPIGGPGKVILKATRGAGAAGAQIFVK